jgi:hypothetical protein
LTIDHSQVSYNATAANALAGGTIVTADTKYAFNSGTALSVAAGGNIFSYGTNRVHNNASSGSSVPVTQQ